MSAHITMCVEVRGKLMRVGSLLLSMWVHLAAGAGASSH